MTGAAMLAALAVTMPGKVFAPATLEVVAGDTVTWHNNDGELHNLGAADGSFGPGPLGPDESYAHAFTTPGTYGCACSIHATMTGMVRVVAIALMPPDAVPASGERYMLHGRAPAGTGPVTLVRDGAPVTTVQPAADGTFMAELTAGATATWQAVAGAIAGDPVVVRVTDRVRLRLRPQVGRHRMLLRASTSPARPGAQVALQLYSPERFAWRQVVHSCSTSTAGRRSRSARTSAAAPGWCSATSPVRTWSS